MNKNKASLIIGVVVILASVGVVVFQHSSSNVAPAVTPSTTPIVTYTMADVTSHNLQTNCWTAINGDVYDVASWISKHPGGAQAIIGMCGIDGSAAFNGQHGGQKRPATELASFKIGVLK